MDDKVRAKFEEFWRPLVCNEDGTLNIEAVYNELYDYERLLASVPLVYDHVTGGLASKANTDAKVIIALHDDRRTEDATEAATEERQRIKDAAQPFKSDTWTDIDTAETEYYLVPAHVMEEE